MPSPLERDAGVLTLGCGHLYSWRGRWDTAPKEVDCPNCGKPLFNALGLDPMEMQLMDTAVRALRIRRGKWPKQ